MNKRIARELREICNPCDPVSKRVYRRLKKQYTKLPHYAKRDFLNLLKDTTFSMDPKQSGSILDKE
jgi:hypothetical protein|tara:strand:+ start:11527 stop:11724 length:198 start_codon:yes stop_codon:yes gene_type:complete